MDQYKSLTNFYKRVKFEIEEINLFFTFPSVAKEREERMFFELASINGSSVFDY